MRIALPLLMFALAACSADNPESDPVEEDGEVSVPAAGAVSDTALAGRRWVLVSVGGAEAQSGGAQGAPYLELAAAEGRASGHAGCNRFSGPYTLSGDSLSFGALVSTKMACADEPMNAQETAFLGALAETRTWRMAGDTLVLAGSGGELARLLAQR